MFLAPVRVRVRSALAIAHGPAARLPTECDCEPISEGQQRTEAASIGRTKFYLPEFRTEKAKARSVSHPPAGDFAHVAETFYPAPPPDTYVCRKCNTPGVSTYAIISWQ